MTAPLELDRRAAPVKHSDSTPAPLGSVPARIKSAAAYLIVAVVCYVPLLLTKPGVVSDDTKTYLYLDPGRLLREAASMWDPSVALGTVTHQNIGYLLPMGPFFWVFSVLHVPMWVAQRLWMGSILFAAGAGVLYLCRVVGVHGPGRVVAALAYCMTPYVMQYAGRIDVILLPYSGLPWMMAFIVLAVRRPGWRYPAMFALVVALVSGINASSVIYVGVAPVFYLLYSVFVSHEATGREAWAVFLKTGLLTLLVSLWWIAGLAVEGAYGVDILKYTESVSAASSAAGASEVVRGLGYWYFYNGDRLGLWTQSSIDFTTKWWLITLSYLAPIGGLLSAALLRWKERAFFALLLLVGLVLSVGSHPYSSPTPLGAIDKALMTHTTFGMALRSTDRATPLVVLAVAVLLGAGVSALVLRMPRAGLVTAAVAGVLVVAANAPLLGGDAVIDQFSQPAHPPSYVTQAADYLNSVSPGTRVYDLPGNNFAAYRYGNTIDPIWPALLNRPFVVHEQFIQGSLPTANLLYAIDNPLQQGTMNWNALAPISRLMSAGDVLVEYDQAFERYNTPRPALLLQGLNPTPKGLGQPVTFGTPVENVPTIPMLDETYFDLPPGYPSVAPLAVYPVSNPRPVVRAESLTDPMVVDGDNAGVVDAADVGLIAANPTILFAGTLDTNKSLAAHVLTRPAQLVVTDTNRKQAFEWNSLSENTGYTETSTEGTTAFTLDDPGFDLFPGTSASAETTSVLTGNVASVTASSYGTAFTLRSEFRPANAIDGDPHTQWATEGSLETPLIDGWWQLTTKHAVSADSVRLVQPLTQANESWLTNQYITKVTLTFDGHDPMTVDLGPESRTAQGQVVAFPARKFSTMRITIDDTNFLHSASQAPPVGSSLVGFSTVDVGDVKTSQIVAMPTDLLSRTGTTSQHDRLTLIATRDRVAPVPPRQDPETSIVRQFTLPTRRAFTLTGTARLSNQVADDVVDSLVGRTDPQVVAATSSSRMPGNLGATASATLDGDPATVWMPGLGSRANQGSWLQYQLRSPLTFDHLTLTVASDAEHSRPTSVVVSAGGVSRTVAVPAIPVTPNPGSVTPVTVSFPALTGSTVRITFSGLDPRYTDSYETSLSTMLPIGIAETSIPGVSGAHLPAQIPVQCRSDLLRIDGQAVPVAISGSTAAALSGGPLTVSACGGATAGVTLSPGTHLLQAADGSVTGLDIDQLALDSAPEGAAMPLASPGQLQPAPQAHDAPAVTVAKQSATDLHVTVHGAHGLFLMVLGQSINKGWQASARGGTTASGSTLVDGFANGWEVQPDHGSGTITMNLQFAPQRAVDLTLLISGGTIVVCLVIVLLAAWRRRQRPRAVLPEMTARLVQLRDLEPAGTSGRVVALGALAALVVGWGIGGPFAGVAAAIGLALGLRTLGGRIALRAASAVLLAVAGAAVVLQEHFSRYVPGSGWAAHFSAASTLVWVAVVLLAADCAIDLMAQRREHLAANRTEEAQG